MADGAGGEGERRRACPGIDHCWLQGDDCEHCIPAELQDMALVLERELCPAYLAPALARRVARLQAVGLAKHLRGVLPNLLALPLRRQRDHEVLRLLDAGVNPEAIAQRHDLSLSQVRRIRAARGQD